MQHEIRRPCLNFEQLALLLIFCKNLNGILASLGHPSKGNTNMLTSETDITNLTDSKLNISLLNLKHALINKAEKISSSDKAYNIGVQVIPKIIKSILAEKCPSAYWAFEGSVGRGTWSRTPWIALYDERVTSRASDGFFITFIISEDRESVFLNLMNSSLKHYNYTPFRLTNTDVTKISDFNIGKIPTRELSSSGRGTGPDFEQSTLLWKKYTIAEDSLKTLESDFLLLANYYIGLVNSLKDRLPKDKPFKTNPFLIK